MCQKPSPCLSFSRSITNWARTDEGVGRGRAMIRKLSISTREFFSSSMMVLCSHCVIFAPTPSNPLSDSVGEHFKNLSPSCCQIVITRVISGFGSPIIWNSMELSLYASRIWKRNNLKIQYQSARKISCKYDWPLDFTFVG